MAGVKGLLARVRKMEPRAGAVELRLGPLERFETECMLGVMSGRYDPVDMPQISRIVQGWVEKGL